MPIQLDKEYPLIYSQEIDEEYNENYVGGTLNKTIEEKGDAVELRACPSSLTVAANYENIKKELRAAALEYNNLSNIIQTNTKKWVGKYFIREGYPCILDSLSMIQTKPIKTYYKVISAQMENEYRVGVFCFEEYPIFNLKSKLRKNYITEDLLFKKGSLKSFWVDTIMIKTLEKTVKEISKEEWERAFDKHCKCLKNMEFKDENEKERYKN